MGFKMSSINLSVRAELIEYQILAQELKDRFGELDHETLQDTLEGISRLPEAIGAVLRSSLEDEALIGSLKARLNDLDVRLERLRGRYAAKRELVRWAMDKSGLSKLQAEDFSASLRRSPDKLEVLSEDLIPANYFTPQPPRLDRRCLADALKGGATVEGARLLEGELSLSVRVR